MPARVRSFYHCFVRGSGLELVTEQRSEVTALSVWKDHGPSRVISIVLPFGGFGSGEGVGTVRAQ